MSNSVNKHRAPNNRTLTLSEQERQHYATKVVVPTLSEQLPLEKVLNTTLCAQLLEVLPLLPQGFADLIIIDPPYNLNKDFHGTTFKSLSAAEYKLYLRSWFPQVVALLKPSGSLYICGDWKSTSALQEVMEEQLTVINRITWQREKGRGSDSNWKNAMEDIWFGVKNKDDYYFNADAVKMKRKVIAPYKADGKPKDWQETDNGNFRLTYHSNFWDDISVPYWSMPENTDHPTQKPEKLIAKLILASSPPDALIFDPFLGSGTTSVVAKKLGRRYIGVEMNMEYCLWAEKRLAQAEQDPAIQGYTEGVFWERNTILTKRTSAKKAPKPHTN